MTKTIISELHVGTFVKLYDCYADDSDSIYTVVSISENTDDLVTCPVGDTTLYNTTIDMVEIFFNDSDIIEIDGERGYYQIIEVHDNSIDCMKVAEHNEYPALKTIKASEIIETNL